MKVSIITVVYNNETTIAEAITSVLDQTYKHIEYIVVDGASKDRTVEIIKGFADRIDTFVSEPDHGIYDALNKGVRLATGDIVAILHSDDLYAENDTVEKVVAKFQEGVDGIYGDLVYVMKNDPAKVFRYWRGREYKPELLVQGWMPAHPTLFLRREVYERFGGFDTGFKIAADYDFILRVFSGNVNIRYLPELVYKIRLGGASNKSIGNIVKKSREDLRALRKNRVGGVTTLAYKNLRKLEQFISRKQES